MGQAQLLAALVKAQAEFDEVERNSVGQSGQRKYPYATLNSAVSTVRPVLAKHGLGFMHEPRSTADGGGHEIAGTIFHESGEERSIVWRLDPADLNGMHAIGSSITYMRRYLLLAMLGIAVSDEEDTDGRESMEGRQRRSNDSPPEGVGRAGRSKGTPARALPDGADVIVEVEAKDTSKGPRWVVHTERGIEASTFSQELSEIATAAADSGELVVLTTKPWKSGNASGLNLDNIQKYQAPQAAAAPPASAPPKSGAPASAPASPPAAKPPAARPVRTRLQVQPLEEQSINGQRAWLGDAVGADGEVHQFGIMQPDLVELWNNAATLGDSIDVTWAITPRGGRLVMRIDTVPQEPKST